MGAMRREIELVGRGTNSMSEWDEMREQAQTLVSSRFLPKAIDTAEKAIAVIMTGKELGLGTMQSLRSIHIVEGKPTMAAELMSALVAERIPGALLRVAETSEKRCVVEAGRPGTQATNFTWTLEDARVAGLLNKDNWKKYPRAMLRSRAVSEACRAVFPDAIIGVYTPDELGVEVASDGSPLPVLPAEPKRLPQVASQPNDQRPPELKRGNIDELLDMIAEATSIEQVAAASKIAKRYSWTDAELKALGAAGNAAKDRVSIQQPQTDTTTDRGDDPDQY